MLGVLALGVALLPQTDPAPYDATQFATDMLGAVTAALPYIGGGVAAGVVVFGVVFGIRQGIKALRKVAS